MYFKITTEICRCYTIPKSSGELDYDELINVLEKYLAPKQNILLVEHYFLSISHTQESLVADAGTCNISWDITD